MILIISNEEDRSTSDVIDWLRFYNCKYLRISYNDIISLAKLTISYSDIEIEFVVKNKKYNLSEFTNIWYRRSWVNIRNYFFNSEDNQLQKAVNNQLSSEKKSVTDYFVHYLEKTSLNSQNDNSLNKLVVLEQCIKYDIKIPRTIVTTKKDVVIEFIKKHNELITKNISAGVFLNYNEYSFSCLAKLVTNDMIKLMPDEFSLMMFQEYIEKIFEIRVFYLNGHFYSSTIISQSDNKTKVDFRDYNYTKPNRTPPYNLPDDLKLKISKLMNKLNLKSGSIDILVNKKGEHIFLEVNPIGQFAQVSIPCNYYLEEKIANYLISNQ